VGVFGRFPFGDSVGALDVGHWEFRTPGPACWSVGFIQCETRMFWGLLPAVRGCHLLGGLLRTFVMCEVLW